MFASQFARRRSRRAAGFRPRLEAFEERTLPSFLAPVSNPVAAGPQAVVAADLNGDGRADLVTANYTSQTVSVLLSTGNGSFAPAHNYAARVSAGPSAVAVSDINGDGKLDIVTGQSFLLGNGDGTFKAAQNTGIGAGPVAVGDFNGDKRPDIATGSSGDMNSGYVDLFLNNGKKSVGFYGGSNSSLLYGSPVAMTAADLNHDGKADLIVAVDSVDAGTRYGNVSVLLGSTSGFQSAQSYYLSYPPTSVAVGDVNGDGKLDVVTGSSVFDSYGYSTGTGTVNVALGNGDGTFGSSRSWAVASSPAAVALADITGDGKLDIVTANYGNNTMSVLPGDGDGTFGLAQNYAAGTSNLVPALAVGDFNGDHRPDVAVTDDPTFYSGGSGPSVVSVLLNAGDWPTARFAVSGFPTSTTAGAASSFTVTVKNANGTTDVGYTGTVHFVCTDSQAGLPADYTFTAADQGTHTFSAALKTVGIHNLSATDSQAGVIAGGETGITVLPGAASTFSFRPGYAEAPYGTTVSSPITAYDAYGNVATGYNGTVHFTSTDPLAVLPPDTSLSNGAGQFSATLNTAGGQSITATDTANPNVTGTWQVAVMPSVGITGPTIGLVNQPLTFTLLAGGAPAGADYTFIVQWQTANATIATQTVTGPTGTTVTLTDTYTNWIYNGATTLSVWAYAGGVPSTTTATHDVNVLNATATVQADPADSTKQMLVLDATQYNGNLGAPLNIGLGAGANNGATVTVDGTAVGNFTTSDGSPFALVEVLGSHYSNTIDARGLTVSTVLVGREGSDVLYGGSGRNLLIGGAGADTLYAGSAGDILIGGATSYDVDTTALAFIMAEWDRTDVDYATRVKHLNGTLSGGLNGLYLLNSATVTDDGAVDVLYGGAGLDWYIGHFSGTTPDKVNGQTGGETATSI
jgi:hypothetical protein